MFQSGDKRKEREIRNDRAGCCSGNVLGLHPGGALFEFRQGHQLSRLKYFMRYSEIAPGSGFGNFLPNPFQCIIHQSSYYSTLSIVPASDNYDAGENGGMMIGREN
jgi:hypothetical protein